MAKRKRLLISEIDSVGGVDAGDNPAATLLFWKRRKGTPDVEGDIEGVLMDGETVADKETQEEFDKSVELADAETAAEPAETEIEEVDKRAEEVAKLAAERDAAVQALAEEVEKRETAEWVEKAKPYEQLMGPAVTLGPALRKISLACPDEFGVLEAALKVASSRDHLAKLFAEFGTAAGEGTPTDRRDAYVQEMRKLHPNMTVAEARSRFWQDHPEAVKASREGV